MAATRVRKLRNPLSGFALTIVGALALTVLVSIPTLLIPFPELRAIVLAFVLFGVGAAAGRTSYLGWMGFAGAFVGGFFGSVLFQSLFWPTGGWEYLLGLALGATCGIGGGVTGKLGLRRVARVVKALPRARRCQRCGARVGLTAQKCWSCRAFLPQA
ncbi:MAG: hypothetical protein A3K65_10030 [Euryarchaeota archaeon RBG_16_68_12]|nr:MAG: hypothetical protein A3K65_10030 [Euryarchaeota archaeon RBG_16_68_12]